MKISKEHKLTPFAKEMGSELCRWIRNEKELVYWSGNTFRGKSFSEQAMHIHLRNKMIFPYSIKDHYGNLLAYGEIVKKDHNRINLCRIIVNPKNRGMGVGRLFGQLLLEECKTFTSYKSVRLNLLKGNTAAIRCYLSLGFRQIGRVSRARKIGSEEVDLIIMSKSINVK